MAQVQLDSECLEEQTMGSINHSIAQTQLTRWFANDPRFFTFVELSLDASIADLSLFNFKIKDEIIPDICVYTNPPPQPNPTFEEDILKVAQMPELAIEVLSPTQAVNFLVRKIKVYFALGVKSCWLVEPTVNVIHVYSQPDQHHTYGMRDSEVVDAVMDIRLPIQQVFSLS